MFIKLSIHQLPPPPSLWLSVALSTWLQKDWLTTELPITLGVGWVISLSAWLSIGTVVILGGRVIHLQSNTSINLSLSLWLRNWTVVILGGGEGRLTEYLDCGYGQFSCGTGMSRPLGGRASLPGASPSRRCWGQSGVSSRPPEHGMRSRWTPRGDPGSTWSSWKHYPAAPEKGQVNWNADFNRQKMGISSAKNPILFFLWMTTDSKNGSNSTPVCLSDKIRIA